MNSLGEKILLSLLAGVAFGCSINSRHQWYIIKTTTKLWKGPDIGNFGNSIRDLNRTKMIKKVDNKDGTYILELTDKGKSKASNYYFKNLKIENRKWDGKWRILMFDIPERLRKGRNSLRWKIKKMGFYELQKSVFITPYECKEEIKYVVDFFALGKYVNFGILESISDETNIKKIFELD